MTGKYYNFKTKTKEFLDNAEKIMSELKGKKVLIYGDVGNYAELNNKYRFKEVFDIVAFASADSRKKLSKSYGIKNIKQKEISDIEFDAILITVEHNPAIIAKDLKSELGEDTDVKVMFVEEHLDADFSLEYLLKYKFDKTLPKLIEKMKGKKVLFYGAGLFFRVIYQYYDLSGLDVIGIADKQFSQLDDCDEICGYKLYKPEDITKLNPDYVLITTKVIISIAEFLYSKYLKNTSIKIMPLVKKGFFETIKSG